MELTPAFPPIAIVGISALFPDADGTGAFWRNIAGGKDSIREVPPGYWLAEDYYSPEMLAPLKLYTTRGGFLPGVAFDPAAFGLPVASLKSTDSIQLLALQVARRLLDDTRSAREGRLDPDRIGVVLGMAAATELVCEMAAKMQRPVWRKVLREQGLPETMVERICKGIENEYVPWSTATFPGLLSNVVAGRITNRFGLGGINCVVDAACASSLAALNLAVKSLAAGESDLVIAGGADALNAEFIFMCFCRTLALSPTGDCRPFAQDADGTILGEGLGMMALRRLEDAERDGDAIYAVIRGVGASSDGHCKSVYATNVGGQVLALDRAYRQAGFGKESVELVEAHGSGTRAGDAVELAALAQAFSGAGPWPVRVALGSIKSQIGHAKAAAGAAGLCKAVLALLHKVYPPTLKVSAPEPGFQIQETPFYLNTLKRPWIHPQEAPRRAGVSSFGFGGSNFHAVLEEYGGTAPPRFPTAGKALLLFSAPSTAALEAAMSDGAALAGSKGLWHLARELQFGFDPGSPCRLAVLVDPAEGAACVLERALARLRQAPERPAAVPGECWYLPHLSRPGVAFLFPGEGSQRVQMGADLACEFEPALAVWTAAAAIDLDGGPRLHELVFPEPAFTEEERQAQQSRLDRPEWARPAIGVASLAWLAVLERFQIRPVAVGGMGCAEQVLGAFPGLEAFVRSARDRGEAIRDACADGMVRPARFEDQITAMRRAGAEVFLELGPGSALAGQVEAVLGGTALALVLDDPARGCLEGLWSALGALSGAGIAVDYRSFWLTFRPPEEEPVAEGHGSVVLNGFNFGKVYPPVGGVDGLPCPNPEP